MLAKFSGVVLSYVVKRVREIRKFHVAVMQRRLRNVHKSVMHVQSCFFADINPLPFSSSLCRRRHRCLSSILLWSRNFATMVTWRHTSPFNTDTPSIRTLSMAPQCLHLKGFDRTDYDRAGTYRETIVGLLSLLCKWSTSMAAKIPGDIDDIKVSRVNSLCKLTCCSTICIWLMSLDMCGLLSKWSISMATASLPPLAALDLCRMDPCIAVACRPSTALPWENCSLLSFCCLRF